MVALKDLKMAEMMEHQKVVLKAGLLGNQMVARMVVTSVL